LLVIWGRTPKPMPSVRRAMCVGGIASVRSGWAGCGAGPEQPANRRARSQARQAQTGGPYRPPEGPTGGPLTVYSNGCAAPRPAVFGGRSIYPSARERLLKFQCSGVVQVLEGDDAPVLVTLGAVEPLDQAVQVVGRQLRHLPGLVVEHLAR